MKNYSIYSNNWCNLVFEGRNQLYGAYQLRKESEKNTLFAFFVSVCFATVCLSFPFFLSIFHEPLPEPVPAADPHVFDLYPPVEIVEPQKPSGSPEKQKHVNKDLFTIISKDQKDKNDQQVNDDQNIPSDLMDVDSTGTELAGKSDTLIEASMGVDKTEYTIGIDKMPEFPGGEKALFNFYERNVRYPIDAYERNVTGTVYISFLINKEGRVTDVNILRGIAGVPSLGFEAKRVTSMLPAWKPGCQHGKPVNVRYTLPVGFHLK